MLDRDLALLYQVPTKVLNQTVRRNLKRFPPEFMFQLTENESSALRSQIVTLETENLRSQIVTSRSKHGGSRHLPHAFSEHGVTMLSSVLNSDRAIQMNILIINAFIRLREMIAHNKDLAMRIEKLESGHQRISSIIEVLVDEIDNITEEVRDMKKLPLLSKRKIGFDL